VLLHADFGHILWFAGRTEGEIRTAIERNDTLFRDRVRGKARFDQLLRSLTTADRHFIITQHLVAQDDHGRQAGESVRVSIRGLPGRDASEVSYHDNRRGEREARVKRPGRLLVCGSTTLPVGLVEVARALGEAIVRNSTFVLVNGGRRNQPFPTTDAAVVDGAVIALSALRIDPRTRVLTVLEEAPEA
jgi:hypothetical protein